MPLPPAQAGSMKRARLAVHRGSGRPPVILGLVLLTGLCWCYLVWRALQPVPGQGAFGLPSIAVAQDTPPPYRPTELLPVLAIWTVIMAAVMLPAAARVVLLFASVSRLHHRVRHPGIGTLLFII